MFTATLGSFSRISFFSQLSFTRDAFRAPSISFPFSNQFSFSKYGHKLTVLRRPWYHTAKVSVSGDTQIEENPESDTHIEENPESQIHDDPSASQDAIRLARVCCAFSFTSLGIYSGLVILGHI